MPYYYNRKRNKKIEEDTKNKETAEKSAVSESVSA